MLTNKEKEILKTFAVILPRMGDKKKRDLLNFGRGMAFKVEDFKKAKAG